MSYAVATRHEILATLTCHGPVHVGGWEATADADLMIARDGTGHPYLPGTSIAGAVRAYLAATGRFDQAQLSALFGHVKPGTRDGSPSWIRIDDAHLIDDDPGTVTPCAPPTPVIRDGVGIDRCSGSAAKGFLYTREVLPAGTRFALRMVADTPTAAPPPDVPGGWPALVDTAVDTIVAGLTHGRVPIGAGRGRGLGQVALSAITIRTADLSTPTGLVAWLTGTAPLRTSTASQPPTDDRLRITISWRPRTPLLVRDSVEGTVVDTLPLTATSTDGAVRLLLPGSSIRGAVRAHAERIVRTLRHQDAPPTIDEALRNPPDGVDVLFGTAPRGRGTTDGRRGVLAVADCHSLGHIDTQQWAPIVTTVPAGAPTDDRRDARQQRSTARDAARAALHHHLDQISSALPLAVSDHVAIDRWTGGASDHRLFSVLEPATTTGWEPIQITVDVGRLHRYPTDTTPHALPLLLLVLRDLTDGWISLGFGGTRGHGQIEVTDITFDGAGLTTPWQALVGCTLASILADPPVEITDAMAAWADHLAQEAA